MNFLLPLAILMLAFVGNCGFWLFCFNRINASGLARIWTKRFEKLFVLLCFVIPCLVLTRDLCVLVEHYVSSQVNGLSTDGHERLWFGLWPRNAFVSGTWVVLSLFSFVVLGIPWLESRRWLWPPKHLLGTQVKHFDVAKAVGGSSAATRATRMLELLPGNEISRLDVTRKELLMPRGIAGLDGFTIGHISDLHFTGQFSLEHYHFVIDRFLELQPQLIVITGDIIDYARCLPWIEPLLGRLKAPLGCTYLLGNHDKRLADLSELTSRIDALGHFDLGVCDQTLELGTGLKIRLLGNELPWLKRHAGEVVLQRLALEQDPGRDEFRVGLSHSPDQIHWARKLKLDLLLAGHTHGGQVRIPGVGPLVSPSSFGSRFASGVFYRSPTIMHVSRGVSGTHPLRYRCPPEVSLLTLREEPGL